jgi:elongator complex protein 3
MEPGAQRAAQNEFDPYRQTLQRLRAYFHNGHPVDKVELIVLGGTWSSYPEDYQRWFLQQCFVALNAFRPDQEYLQKLWDQAEACPWGVRQLHDEVHGASLRQSYNRIVSDYLEKQAGLEESASWQDLGAEQRQNEKALARCVGLSLETRPDVVTPGEVHQLRRLGATKIQIGIQSLSDEVLEMNQRGHTVALTRQAMYWLRAAGFKIQAHWMPNLYGSSPEEDVHDFARLFEDPDLRPDELKIYPCSLIESAELMVHYEAGRWQPYTSFATFPRPTFSSAARATTCARPSNRSSRSSASEFETFARGRSAVSSRERKRSPPKSRNTRLL